MRPYRAPVDTIRAHDRRGRRAAMFALPLAAVATLAAGRVGADVIVVSSCASSGAGSLFDAIQTANTIGAGTNVEIEFSAALSGHSVALDAVTLQRSMTITGLSGLKIVGADTEGGALISVAKGAGNVQLSSMAITSPGGTGIGIASGASLSLSGTSVFDCGKFGIQSDGCLTLQDSKVTCNSSNGILSDGQVSVFNSALTSNGGLGIKADAGCVNIYGSCVDSNGGIGISVVGSLTVDATSVSCNLGDGVLATGQVSIRGGSVLNGNNGDGLAATGSVDVQDSTFSANQGNGVTVAGDGAATIARSTMDHNQADGVYSSTSNLTVVNDTLAFNKGKGLSDHAGATTLLNDTLAYNGENGIENFTGDGNAVGLGNTLAALNGWADVAGEFDDEGYNLLGTYDAVGADNAVGTPWSNVDVGEIGLSDQLTKDGMTSVLALLPGSAAIDRASPVHVPDTDQRGVVRPQPIGGRADIGAYELSDTGQPSVGTTAPLPSSARLAMGLLVGVGAWGHLSSRLRRKVAAERAS